jgi:transcriptional regulator with XRE-family HTH domain
MKTTMGQRIKAARERIGLNQKEFAELLGKTPAAVCQFEKDQRQPRLACLNRITQILGVSTEYLLRGTLSVLEYADSTPPSREENEFEEIIRTCLALSPVRRRLALEILRLVQRMEDGS